MNLDLSGKTALVGGASQGLGAAVAQELAQLGANVILLARNEENLKRVQQTLDTGLKQMHHYIIADTMQPDELIKELQAYLGADKRVDILVNNTGGPSSGPLVDTPVMELEAAFRSHLITAHLLVQTVVEGMKKEGFGRIINILSTAVKEPIPGLGISNTVRAAVANWSKTLAGELGPFGITVNNVLPGFTKTGRLNYLFGKQAEAAGTTTEKIMEKNAELIPVKRLGEPEEFAAAVAFLCSPAAAYINGVNLPVDGGRLAGL